jgi:TPR repeat protein/DNA-binding XRE family transcriptional regulator
MIQQPTQQPPPDPLGSLVRYVREYELLLSQADLAWLAGVSRGTISNLENGRVRPDARTWQRIRAAMALSPLSLDQPDDIGAGLLFPADGVRGVLKAILTIGDRDKDAGIRIAGHWQQLVLRSTGQDDLSGLVQQLITEVPSSMAPLLRSTVQGRSAAASAVVSVALDQVQELASSVNDLAKQLRFRDDRAQGFERLPAAVQELLARGLVVSCDVTKPETTAGVAIVNMIIMSEPEASLAAQQEAHNAARRWNTVLAVATHIVEKQAPGLNADEIIQALESGLDAQSPAEIKELLPQARGGDPNAMYKLARLLRKQRRPTPAADWLHRAALAGHPGAQYTLGNLASQDGRRGDAERWWRDAADAGHPDAMYSLWALLRQQDPMAAESWLRAAADAENRNAMYCLWQLLRESTRPEAEQWLRRAADHGHQQAIVDLSNLVEEDEAFRLRRRAAEDGDTGVFTLYEFNLYEKHMREQAAARNAAARNAS